MNFQQLRDQLGESNWVRPIVAGVLSGSVVLIVIFGYIYLAETASLSLPSVLSPAFFQFLIYFVVGGLLTFGLPVTVYVRYGLKLPLAVMVVIPSFWFVASNIGSPGDSIWQGFMLIFSPIYVLLYVIIGAAEHYFIS
jgi:hypothetical protein